MDPLVLTCGDDERIIVWNIFEGKVRTIKNRNGDGSGFNSIAMYAPCNHSTDSVVVSGQQDGSVVLWDLHSGEMVRSYDYGHSDAVMSVAVYTPTDKASTPFIVSVSIDGTAMVWDLFSGNLSPQRELLGGHVNESLNSVTIYVVPDGSALPYIITADGDVSVDCSFYCIVF